MYKVLCDGKVLYAPNLVNSGFVLLNPKITMELNKSGSMNFVIPPNNGLYNDVHKLKSIIQVFDEDTEIFRGRVLHDEKDFYKRKSVYCEGDLAFLLDSVQRIYDYQGTLGGLFRQYIENHNQQVEEEKQFVVGDVTVTDQNNYVHYSSSQYPNTLEEINNKLIGTHGGYIRTRLENGVRYIDYVEDYTHVSQQIIEFGVNMLDLSEYISAENVFTVLIPLGAKQGQSESRLTIESVNDGKDYIQNDSAVALFGKVWKVQIWDDVTVPSNLLTKGQSFLNDGIQMSVALKMKALDLHLANVNVERIQLGDYIKVISVPHGINTLFQCTKITLDLVNPARSEFEFGVAFTSLTDFLNGK